VRDRSTAFALVLAALALAAAIGSFATSPNWNAVESDVRKLRELAESAKSESAVTERPAKPGPMRDPLITLVALAIALIALRRKP
jgi:hypothetical protein